MPGREEGLRSLVGRVGGLVVGGVAYLPIEATPAEAEARTAETAGKKAKGAAPGNRKARRRAEALARRGS